MWEPDYCTTDELKAFVRIADALDDVQIGLALAAAARAVDRATRRQFGRVDAPETRHYTARPDPVFERWVVAVDDLMDDVGVAVAFDSAGDGSYGTPIPAWALRPVNAAQRGRPWEDLVLRPAVGVTLTGDDAAVQVTARWGWAAVPDAVKEATLLQASRLLSRRDSPYGIAGSPETGSELRLLARVDPDVEVALASYHRSTGVGFA